jgi:hypothetical protein
MVIVTECGNWSPAAHSYTETSEARVFKCYELTESNLKSESGPNAEQHNRGKCMPAMPMTQQPLLHA